MVFGLSWDQIILILLAALFLLGPERIPVAIRWIMDSLRKLRSMAAGAQAEMRSQLGPEIDELRRQVAELQSLKEVSELRALRDLDPRRMVGKGVLGDEFSGGMAGFLGLNKVPSPSPPSPSPPSAPVDTSAVQPQQGVAAADSPPASASPTSAPSNGAAPTVGAQTQTQTAPNPKASVWVDGDVT